MKELLTYFILITIVIACSNIKTNENQIDNQQSHTKKDTIDWTNQNVCFDNLAKYDVDKNEWEHIKLEFYRNKKDNHTYLLTCETETGVVWHSLPFNIDFDTYQDFGRYGVDQNNVYYRFTIYGGDRINILDAADRETFIVLGETTYAKDNNHVYRKGKIIVDADVKTFEVFDFESNIPLARDKNNVYIWGEILQDTTEIEGLKEYLKNEK